MNILITGVSSGLGKELSKQLLANGNLVWGLSRKGMNSLAIQDLAVNKKFIYSQCDISREDNPKTSI